MEKAVAIRHHLLHPDNPIAQTGRGERGRRILRLAPPRSPRPSKAPTCELAAPARGAWVRLIRKGYEADPL